MRIKIWKLLGLLSIVIFMLSTAASVHAATLTTVIQTNNDPYGVVYDPAMHEIFVSNCLSGDIQVINDSTNQQVADILSPYASAPYNLAYDSNKGEIWVAEDTGAYVILDANDTIVANVTNIVPNEGGLIGVAYDPSTGEVFVSYNYNGLVQVISDSSNTIIANLTQTVAGMVDDSAKSEIFAAQSGYGSGSIYVISAKTDAVTATIAATTDIPGASTVTPEELAYDSGKGEIFVGSYVFVSTTGVTSDVVQVISDSTNKVVANIDLPTSVGLGLMAYNPNKGEIYIDDVSSVAIISDSTNALVGTVNTNGTAGGAGGGIAYDSGTGTVYAVNNEGYPGGLAVISDSTIPEFSSVALILTLIFATSAIVLAARKLPRRRIQLAC